jgi:energy-coupling factor transporter ATP-binding protein EcfA2
LRAKKQGLHKILFSSKSGLIIHSSAMYDNHAVYVFGGVSGSGKSTIARKLNGIMTPINDEKNVLEFKNDGISVYTHFLKSDDDHKEYLVNEDLSGTLKAFFFLNKESGTESRIEPLSDKGYIWKMLLKCAAPPSEGEDHFFPAYLEMVDRLIESVPFYDFYYNTSDSQEDLAELLRKTC